MCFSVEIKKESFYLLSLRFLSSLFCSFNNFIFFRSCMMIISIISAIGKIIGANTRKNANICSILYPLFYDYMKFVGGSQGRSLYGFRFFNLNCRDLDRYGCDYDRFAPRSNGRSFIYVAGVSRKDD